MDLVSQPLEIICMNEEKNFKITPSGVDYALKCKRCLSQYYFLLNKLQK